MKLWENIIQGSDEWMALRELRPTASNCSKIITATGKDSASWGPYAKELANNKNQPRAIRESGIWTGNRHTDRGHELEQAAREAFTKRTGLQVAEVGFITRDDGIWGCSPDGLVIDSGKPMAGVEIKCPQGHKHLEHLDGDTLPAEYLQQVHCSMVVTGFSAWYFVSYAVLWKPLIFRAERDSYTDKVEDAMNRFQAFFTAERARLLQYADMDERGAE